MTPEFLVTCLVIVASPGAGALFTIAIGLSSGGRNSVIAALGCTLGILPHLAAAIFGLAAILHASALAFQLFQTAGVGYLLYMAWHSLRDSGPLALAAEAPNRSYGDIILRAILLNLLNPKLSIFFLAFLPQFVAADEARPLIHMLGLSGVFMALTFVVFALYGLFAARVRDQVLSRPRILIGLRWSFAAAFAALGIRLALAER